MKPQILIYPDKLLKTKCSDVITFDQTLYDKLDIAKQILLENNALGIAANQLGFLERFFIIKDNTETLVEFINPIILNNSNNKIQINEGCLSLPDVFVQIPRFEEIQVKARTRNNEEFNCVLYGLESIIFQHEYDHLDGIFYLEKTNRQQRRAALRKAKLNE